MDSSSSTQSTTWIGLVAIVDLPSLHGDESHISLLELEYLLLTVDALRECSLGGHCVHVLVRLKGNSNMPKPSAGEILFLNEYRFPIQQPLLPLSFRFRRKPRQHQWHGLFLRFNADGIHHWF